MDKNIGSPHYHSDEGEFSLPEGSLDLVGVDHSRAMMMKSSTTTPTTTTGTSYTPYNQGQQHSSSSSSSRRHHNHHHHHNHPLHGRQHHPPSWKTAVKLVVVNVFVCALVLAYALVGSFVFLALENNRGGLGSSVLASTSSSKNSMNKSSTNLTNIIMSSLGGNEAISQLKSDTVRNIWDITLSMNILYPDNWTKMTNEEVGNFQRFLLEKVITAVENATGSGDGSGGGGLGGGGGSGGFSGYYPWTFPRAFLFALTTLTTIGYGGIGPKTSSGKIATMVYAVFGIPIMLWYLSNVGSLLAKIVRFFCTRLCSCCMCRDLSSTSTSASSSSSTLSPSTRKVDPYYNLKPLETQIPHSSSSNSSSSSSPHRLSICFIFTLCILVLLAYICTGAWVISSWEKWRFLDSFYFCFLTLTTISFGDSRSQRTGRLDQFKATTEWFCSFYILFGMALTSMFFNILHEEISLRFKQWKQHSPSNGGGGSGNGDGMHHHEKQQQQQRIPLENSYSVHFMNFSNPNNPLPNSRNFTEETLLSNEVHRGLAAGGGGDSPKGGGGGGGGGGYDSDEVPPSAFMNTREIYGPPPGHQGGNVFPR